MSDFGDRVRAVDEALPELARDTIRHHLDLGQPDNRRFLAHPDRRDQHQTNWHRWGILTHTRVFLELFGTDVPAYLRDWGMWEDIDEAFSQTLDGVPRWDLLKIAILLHDIGKFGSRTRSSHGFHFSGHERLSGSVIRREAHLERFGLTKAQIQYVAMTAEDHFVLGLVRKRARELGEFTLDFPRSAEFHDLCLRIKDEHQEDYLEVGVLFLGDSLAKVDPVEGPERALSQSPINVAVARGYLATVLDRPLI